MKPSRPPLRILWVDHVCRILGGAEVNLVELLAEDGARQRWQSTIACDPAGRLHETLEDLGAARLPYAFDSILGTLRVVGSRLPLFRSVRSLRELVRARRAFSGILSGLRPDVVVSCTNKDHLVVAPVCRRAGVPGVWWVNDILSADFFPWLARQAFLRSARRHACRLIVVSDYARRVLEQQRLPAGRVVTIHNGIPLERYRRRTRGALRGSLDFPEDAWLIGVLGRFTPWKGQDLFLEIAAEWCARRARGHFVLIGHAFNEDESFERRLREFVRERGLRERIQFVPFQRDVVSALSDLDLLLHTSRKPEPFGRVIIEAMAVGVPVIAARDGGVPEILTHGEDGLLAAPGHTAEYLAHIETLQSDATLRARLIGKARHTLESRFSLARVRADFDHLFDAVS